MVLADELCLIVVCSRRETRQFELHFHSEGAAREVMAALENVSSEARRITVRDNFGSEISFLPGDLGEIIFQRLSGNHEWRVRVSLAEARAQQQAQRRAQADPMLKLETAMMPRGASPS